MLQGFLRLGVSVPYLDIADAYGNGKIICECVNKAFDEGAELLVFPELCLSTATCGDLFLNRTLISDCRKSLESILNSTKDKEIIFIIGLPYEYRGSLYNFSAVIFRGRVLGFVPRMNYDSDLPMSRWFNEWKYGDCTISFGGSEVPVCAEATFICGELSFFINGENGKVPGCVNLIVDQTASLSLTGRDEYIRAKAYKASADKSCVYVYASAGAYESTGFGLFSGSIAVFENGQSLAEDFDNSLDNKQILCDVDIEGMNCIKNKAKCSVRNCMPASSSEIFIQPFSNPNFKNLSREISKVPFLPKKDFEKRLDKIASIQVFSLAGRLKHANVLCPVVGVSGGLDSALTLMVCVSAMKVLGLPASQTIGVTMPGMGTTGHTKSAADMLMNALGVTPLEISIKDACVQHYGMVGISTDDRSTAFENVQARERTQVLMSIANIKNGIVIGTCDMSEIALGWATYGGDQMSMFNVNNSIPKTLVRKMVGHYGKNLNVPDEIISAILNMPVSPELLPAEGNHITQRTEEILGSYDLHDFFIYYFVKYGFSREKIGFLAKEAFKNDCDEEYIDTCLDTFFTRLVTQQFKRSASPDGVKTGSVSLGRGDLVLPSDMSKSTFR